MDCTGITVVDSPPPFLEAILCFIAFFITIHYTFLQLVLPSARYFVLHMFVNMAIIGMTLPTLPLFIQDPARAVFFDQRCVNWLPNILTTSLHMYHLLLYKTKRVDYIHHFPGFIGNLINTVYPTNTLQDFSYLFIMGIPGFIDYLLLILVKYSYIESRLEKYTNSRINLYIRLPGLLTSSISITSSLFLHPYLFHSLTHKCCALIIAVHNSWNAIYFTKVAIDTEIRYNKNK